MKTTLDKLAQKHKFDKDDDAYKALKRILNRGPYYEYGRKTECGTQYVGLLWKEKSGITKFGWLPTESFLTRYGIKTVAKYDNGRYWTQSTTDWKQDLMETLKELDECPQLENLLKEFDFTTIKDIAS
jgi:hypothetical protein